MDYRANPRAVLFDNTYLSKDPETIVLIDPHTNDVSPFLSVLDKKHV